MTAKYGVEIDSLVLENLSVPPEVEEAIDKKAGMAAIGDLNDYVKLQIGRGMESGGSGAGGSRRELRLAARLDALLELLPDLEEGCALRRDLDLGTGLGIAPLARLADLDLEAAEAANLDPIAAAKRLGHAVEDRVDHGLRILLGDVRDARRDALDQITLGHTGELPPFLRVEQD